MTTLLFADHDNTALKPSTLKTLTAASQVGGEVHVLVAGASCEGVAEQVACCPSVSKVLLADAPYFANQGAENLAALMFSLAGAYSHILATASCVGKDFMPRLAALLNVAQISDVLSIVSPEIFIRPMYAGSVLATVQSNDFIKVLAVRSTEFDAAPSEGGIALIERIALTADVAQSRVLTRDFHSSSRPDLATAKVVVAGGRGIGSKADYWALLEPLASKLDAALGASRASVDAGFAPNDLQVGQSGKIVAPELYIAVGISGAIQHVAGMKNSKVIVAINKDPNAPIFQIADYGLVADLHVAVPQLTDAICRSE